MIACPLYSKGQYEYQTTPASSSFLARPPAAAGANPSSRVVHGPSHSRQREDGIERCWWALATPPIGQSAPRLDVIQESKTLMLMDQEDQDAQRFPFPRAQDPRPKTQDRPKPKGGCATCSLPARLAGGDGALLGRSW
ncbi:hypothetical protein CSOJ01_00686 [Colletotrichum sojae]|uniref:Uncharacterized protein n=1 Tax=Colletotrichum sojae TaxID=2175907 RepID=A0A8H6N5N8_9PEZI|nr:hypothetical protein CSOJ01_00686 [Colletotrichum sojae]